MTTGYFTLPKRKYLGYIILLATVAILSHMLLFDELLFQSSVTVNGTNQKQQPRSRSRSRRPITSNSSTSAHLHLVQDKAWFKKKAKAGCCPFAVKLYNHRYGHMHNRCCTNRLNEIKPWRPVGGSNWEMLMEIGLKNRLRNVTLAVQGDSLAEQHYIAMLCHAWSSEGVVEVTNVSKPKGDDVNSTSQGTMWEARIEPIGVTMTFVRWNKPQLAPNFDYAKFTFLIVGGWHHGGASEKEINLFLDQLQDLRGESATIVVQALPNHFPGGSYIKGDSPKYPMAKVDVDNEWSRVTNSLSSIRSDNASDVLNSSLLSQPQPASANNSDQVCDTFAMRTGDPDINDLMEQWMKNRPRSMIILNVMHLYQHRGDAHIGKISPGTLGPSDRDCLHWCVAPGVLDVLSIETLTVIHRYMSHNMSYF